MPKAPSDFHPVNNREKLLDRRNYVLNEMKNRNVKQLILWGGVQIDNIKAVRFYQKNGFRSLGHFQYNGLNEDMMLPL